MKKNTGWLAGWLAGKTIRLNIQGVQQVN